MGTQLYHRPRFRLAGDRGLLMEFGNAIAPEINQRVRAMTHALEADPLPGIHEVIPTYHSIIVIYDPLLTAPDVLQPELLALVERLGQVEMPQPSETIIPVCYGGEFGPDIEAVAAHNGITVEEVIRLHSAPSYPIYMLGFSPGFPFLGGLSDKLHTPRLASPRTLVPAGSVGIANNQTGIYPIASPGGWQLIGRSPVKLFDPGQDNPFLLKAGDRLRFEPISPPAYGEWRGGDGP